MLDDDQLPVAAPGARAGDHAGRSGLHDLSPRPTDVDPLMVGAPSAWPESRSDGAADRPGERWGGRAARRRIGPRQAGRRRPDRLALPGTRPGEPRQKGRHDQRSGDVGLRHKAPLADPRDEDRLAVRDRPRVGDTVEAHQRQDRHSVDASHRIKRLARLQGRVEAALARARRLMLVGEPNGRIGGSEAGATVCVRLEPRGRPPAASLEQDTRSDEKTWTEGRRPNSEARAHEG